jgi:SAM-dependent methyltransferase
MAMRQPIATEFVRCDLCGSENQDLLYTRLDPITGQEFHLVECRCGMAFVNPMPFYQSIPALYPEDYLKDKQDLTPMYRRMMRFLPRGSTGALLDVGCGRGDFIRHAAGYGWEVEGVDLLSWDTPGDIVIHVGDFTKMDLPERHYDVITAWAILEHVRNPSAFFAKISTLLKDTGKLVFLVPNFGAPGMRQSCTEDIPRHLHLFTPRAVRTHLSRFGMEAEAIYHRGTIYTAYPFGLVRYYGLSALRRETSCSRYQNRSVALLRNRQVKGNLMAWLREVVISVSPMDLFLDVLDIGVGVALAAISQLLRSYGVITVVAGLQAKKKQSL